MHWPTKRCGYGGERESARRSGTRVSYFFIRYVVLNGWSVFLNFRLQEKAKRFNEEGDEIEAGLRRMMQMCKIHKADVTQKRQDVVDRINAVKAEALKRAANGAGKK